MIKAMNLSTIKKCILLISLSIFLLSGCASIGRGMTEAFMGRFNSEDTRVCQVRGQSFAGIAPGLAKPHGKTKVLMVHGVGDRLPGYSTELMEKLSNQLKLTAKSSSFKDIQLMSFSDPEKKLGNLRVTRLQNENKSKELWFYELTWSEITRDQKSILAFDNSGEFSFRRATVNNMLKTFTNDTAPDPIIYLGESRELILRSFAQAFCWMGKDSWDDIPGNGRHGCDFTNSLNENFNQDEIVFISHSLGSRIVIDGLTRIVSMLERPNQKSILHTIDKTKREALQKKHVHIFLMSNQLPLLQLGRELPEVTGQKANYCMPNGTNYASRLFSKTSIVAFSDPNDLLSYAIPQNFTEEFLDSRLCINVTNININVASVFEAFGMGKIANPIEAHVGYSRDDRVVALIAEGIGNGHTAPIVKDRCEWTEITD
ncbi:MAG: hypothetical protein LUQ29_12455 [Methylococcaceae bacterium]|jgi:hypothetical protein|nr:hypothetical protein [Methylococcaceae bacterium]